MSIKSTVVEYSKGLFTIGLALAIMFFILNFLHTKGPSFVQGPAGAIGARVSGSSYGW